MHQILHDLFASSSYESLQRCLGRAELLAEYTCFFGDPSLIDKDLEAYLAVTASDVQKVAGKIFTKSQATIVDVQPKDAGNTKGKETLLPGRDSISKSIATR